MRQQLLKGIGLGAVLAWFGLIACGPAAAALYTWDGGSPFSNNWSDGLNWAPNVSPPFSGADIAFAGNVRTTPIADGGYDIMSLMYNPGAAGFDLSGGTLTLRAGGITNSSGSMQTIANNLNLGAAQVWNAAGGPLLMSGTVNNNGYPLTVMASQNTSLMNVLSGGGGLTKDGAGMLILGGGSPNSYGGTTTVQAGTLYLSKAGGAVAVPGNLVIGDGVGGSNADAVRLNGFEEITHAGGTTVTINNSGLLDLSGYTQQLNDLVLVGGAIQGGVLRVGGNFSTQASPSVATIQSTLDFMGVTKTITTAFGSGPRDLDITGTLANGGLTKAGPGWLCLTGSGANSITQATTVNEGMLLLSRTTGGFAGDLVIGDGVGGVYVDVVRLEAHNQISQAPGQTVTINNSGLLNLNNWNDSLANVTLNGGAIGTGVGILTLQNAIVVNASSATAIIAGSLDLGAAPRSLTVARGAAATDLDISAVVSSAGPGGGFSKTGPGILRLSGSAPNTYTGLTQVTEGTLVLAKDAGMRALAGDLGVGEGASAPETDVVRLEASWQLNQAVGRSVTVNHSGLLDLNNFADAAQNLNFAGGRVRTGTGYLTVYGAVTSLADKDGAILDGHLTFAGGTRTFNIADGLAAVDLDVPAEISDGGLLKTGPGLLRFSGSAANIYTGTTTVNEGTLVLAKPAGLKAVPGNLVVGDGLGGAGADVVRLEADEQIASATGQAVTVNSSGLLDIDDHFSPIYRLAMAGGSVTSTGPGRLDLLENLTSQASDGPATISGTLSLYNSVTHAHAFDVADGVAAIDLDIPALLRNESGPPESIVKSGLGTLRLSGANTFSGGLTVQAGTVLVGHDSALGAGPLTLAGGTLQGDGGPRTLSNALTVGADSAVSGSQNLTFTNTVTVNANLAVSGAMKLTLAQGASGSGSMTKDGSGTLALQADSTLNGFSFAGGALTVTTLTIPAGPGNNFTQTGGTFGGTLRSQGIFSVTGGKFDGRLILEGSYAAPVFTADNGVQNLSSISLAAGQSLTANGPGLDNEGTIILAGGVLAGNGPLTNNGRLSGFGTIGGSKGLANNASLAAVGGNITIANTYANVNTGTIDLDAGLQLRLTGGPLTNSGTVNLRGGTVTGAPVTNAADGVITGPGLVVGSFSNAGLLAIPDGTTNFMSAFMNSGLIELTSPTGNLRGAIITNNGTIQGAGKVSNAVSNNGTVCALGGALVVSGALANLPVGTLSAMADGQLIVTGGLATCAGAISLSGGLFSSNGVGLNNTGRISGFGTFSTGGLTNNGSVTFTGGFTTVNGSVTNAAGKQFRVAYDPALFTGNVTNYGLFKSTSTTVTFAGTYVENGTYLSDPSTQYFQDLTVGPSGAIVGGAGDRFIVSGNFVNNSTNTKAWNTAAAELRFYGAGAHTMAVGSPAGALRWGILAVEAGNTLTLSGASATATNTANSGAINQVAGIADLGRIVGPGNLAVGAGATMNALSFRGAGLVDVAGLLSIGMDGSTSTTGALRLADSDDPATGTLDIGTGSLAIDYSAGAPSPLPQVKSWIKQAYNNMAWDGKGITSSAAALLPIIYGVGYTQNDMLFAPYSVFSGEPVDLSTVLVKFTYAGDVNLDGSVDDNDVAILGLFYDGGTTTSHYWNQGDLFGYDGRIDDNDVAIFGLTYGLGIGDPLGGGPAGAVPEPATLALLALGGLAAALRRKRSRRSGRG